MLTLEMPLEKRMASPITDPLSPTSRDAGAVDPQALLLRRIAAGDEDALRQLYALLGQRMTAYAARLTGDSDAANDVVQESLVAVWQSAGRFRGESRVIAWLLGIVHHKALNYLRRNRKPWSLFLHRERREDANDDEIEIAGDQPPLPDQVSRSEQQQALHAGIQALSLEHRMVIDLVFYQELSLAETAEVCGCPVGTVKSRLNYAKSSLRGALTRAGIQVEDIL